MFRRSAGPVQAGTTWTGPSTGFTGLGPGRHDQQAGRDRKIRSHLRQLKALGVDVTAGPVAAKDKDSRAVVAQVLSYAGYLQGLDPDQLDEQILGPYLTARGSVLAAAEADDQQHALDPGGFKQSLARSLAEGGFRLVIVLDSAPDELVQVVGYLQSVTDKIDMGLITVAAYEVAGSQVLVPQRIEPGRRVRELSDARVNARQAGAPHPGSEEFRAVIAELPAVRRDPLLRLAERADMLERDGLVKLPPTAGQAGSPPCYPGSPAMTPDS
jgi:hypothetical protein